MDQTPATSKSLCTAQGIRYSISGIRYSVVFAVQSVAVTFTFVKSTMHTRKTYFFVHNLRPISVALESNVKK